MVTARRRMRTSAALVAAAVVLAGCSSTVAGTPSPVGAPGLTSPQAPPSVPTTVEPTVEPVEPIDLGGPSGPRDRPRAKLDVEGATDSEYDTQAINTIADLYDFYEAAYPEAFDDEPFEPVDLLVSYDAEDPDAEVCGLSVAGEPNAFYIHQCSAIGWDRGVFMPMMNDAVGDLGTPTIIAHEVGHRISGLRGQTLNNTSVLVLEQQADCYAGAYWRWVADGGSTYFDLNQGEGMRAVMTAMLYVSDPVGSSSSHSSAHGTGFDRALAFRHGYDSGLERCDEMDQAEVDDRIQQFSFVKVPTSSDSIPITEEFIDIVAEVVNEYLADELDGYEAPAIVAVPSGTLPACGAREATPPVDYCPDTHTVSYLLDELAEIGTPTDGFNSTNGDFSAVVMLVSRMALAGASSAGEEITGPDAGLTALCRTGAWGGWMREPRGPERLVVGPADYSRALYQVIASPVPSSDVSGVELSSVFDQVSAFATGVVHGAEGC